MPRPLRPSRCLRLSLAILSTLVSLCVEGCLERELTQLSPCLTRKVEEDIDTDGISRVDLLFVVDNSDSMRDEQVLLREQFPRMIELLTGGMRPDGRSFEPVKDLHLGVVSTDLGIPPVQWIGGPDNKCVPPGDDGRLSSTPNPGMDPALTCPAQLAGGLPFLTFSEGQDPAAVARDFQCLATLGTGGCGFEQPLEAAFKALLPSQLPGYDAEALLAFRDPQGVAMPGHGDGHNAGFLRGTVPNAAGLLPEDSLIAVVLVTDEEDCSVRDNSLFEDNPGSQRVNMLCHDQAQKLFEVERYVKGLRALRPSQPERVIFAAIAGIPEGAGLDRGSIDLDDDAAVDAHFEQLLARPEMQAVEGDLDGRVGVRAIRPVCKGAAPARRIVEVARAFGRNGVVHSICDDNFGPAMDAIVEAIVDQLPEVCLPRPLIANVEGMVPGCRVFWDLPQTPLNGQLASCGERGYLSQPGDQPTAGDGRIRCEVQQVPVRGGEPVPGMGGWHYDDFSDAVHEGCGKRGTRSNGGGGGLTASGGQRVAFSEPPGPGVRVGLSCSQENGGGIVLPGSVSDDAPTVGSACADGDGFPDDMRCRSAGPAAGQPPLFCHPITNVCVLACAGNSDCPAAWVCDSRLASTAVTGDRAICVNPTCGE